MKSPILLIPMAALALAGCTSTDRGANRPPVVVERPMGPAVPRHEPQRAGLLIGQTAAALVASFGPPALDVVEGDGRKLQFAGQACVLDAYLYPSRERGGAAVVTHVDTRLRDGRDADRTACAEALARR